MLIITLLEGMHQEGLEKSRFEVLKKKQHCLHFLALSFRGAWDGCEQSQRLLQNDRFYISRAVNWERNGRIAMVSLRTTWDDFRNNAPWFCDFRHCRPISFQLPGQNAQNDVQNPFCLSIVFWRLPHTNYASC